MCQQIVLDLYKIPFCYNLCKEVNIFRSCVLFTVMHPVTAEKNYPL